jgi:predicted  nucleic acid-binding Zn-ribbon protein
MLMIKKTIIATAAVLLAGVLLFGRNTIGYIRTSLGYVHDTVENSVPVGFEIDHARHMIQDLAPEVRKNMHVIAKEEVEVQRLEEQIANSEAKLVKEKEQILRLKTDLATAKDSYSYGGRNYSAAEVRTDLANRFDRYKTGEATLNSLKQVHDARLKSLAAARQKLDGMLAQKRQLQVDVENLEARNQMVAAAQTTSNYQFDDSQLGRVKELVQNVKTRLDVTEKLVGAETEFQGEIPLDKTTPQNIVDQVGDYFGDKKPDAKAVAATEK